MEARRREALASVPIVTHGMALADLVILSGMTLAPAHGFVYSGSPGFDSRTNMFPLPATTSNTTSNY